MGLKVFLITFLIVCLFNIIVVYPVFTYFGLSMSIFSYSGWGIIMFEIPFWSVVQLKVTKLLQK